ncbi:MAG: transcription antitermination factor NusB [Planctomycetes bacterium]|nr:transcription antitermination factor NusB [Planctomycetota bacterium]
MRKRTQAREAALQVLYQLDLRGAEVLEDLDALLQRLLDPSVADPSVAQFARGLVLGCWARRAELDRRIRAIAEHWDLDRMATVDRNVLRLAAFELLFRDNVPPKVAINEAIDLAKRYSTADSGSFVNGILDKIRIEREEAMGSNESGGPEGP